MIHLSRRDLLAGAATVGAADCGDAIRQLRHAGRSAASWRTGPRFLSLQGRFLRVHLDQRRCALVSDAGYVRNQCPEGRRACRG